MVDANGRFSITVARSDLPKFASKNRMSGTPEENQAIVQGSIAYFGTYSIDEPTHVLTVNIEGSTRCNGRAHLIRAAGAQYSASCRSSWRL
jgi:hypothetical protein